MKDVLSRFNRVEVIWTTELFIGEELEMIFSYGSMISYCFSGSGA